MDPTTSSHRFPHVILLVIVVLGATCLPAAPGPAPALAADLFFKPPEFTEPVISPDGKNVGFIAQSNGHACLFRLELGTGQVSGIFSAGEGEVDYFWWIGNHRVLVQGEGERGWQYFVQDLGSAKPREIPVLQRAPRSWITTLPQDNDHVVALNFWGEAYLARVDLNTGHSSKIESFNSNFDERFLADDDWFARYMATQGFDSSFNLTVVSRSGELRAKTWQFAGRWHIAWRARADQPWQTAESSSDDLPVFTPAGMADNDYHILVYARDQGNAVVLMSLDPATGQRTLLAQRPDRDVYGLFREDPGHGFVGAKFPHQGGEDVVFLDEASRKFSVALDRSLPGMNHQVTSSATDGSKRIIRAWLPGYPSQYYLFDAVEHRLSLLGVERPELKVGALGQVRPFQYQTRDGVTESGYVVLPKPQGEAKPFPLLVMAMQAVGERIPVASKFLAEDQFFASRGIAVAHFATRGTAGFGRAFAKAGDFQLAGKIVGDFEDGVGYLAQSGMIDPKRVALIGFRHGGLFALRTAAVSKSFRAVVAYNTPSKLTSNAIMWFSSSTAETPTQAKQVGGTKAAYELVHQLEPEAFVDQLAVPVWLGYASWYGATNSPEEEGNIRTIFDRRHKTYEWDELDYRAAEKLKDFDYQTAFYIKIANFLDKTLK